MGKNRKKKFDPSRSTRNTTVSAKSITEANTVDLFHLLSDDILCLIISFLPFKSAVKTSFLSARWRDLWKKVLVRNGTIEDAVNAISEFLIDFDELYRSSNIWGLQFNFSEGSILLAAVSPNGKLHLDFSTRKQEYPMEFGWLLELNRQEISYPPSLSIFVVKTLYLLSLSNQTRDAVSALVSNFPFLESLTIAKCKGLRSLHIFPSSRLRKLTILDCSQLKSLRIKASRLQSFRYRGKLPWFWLDRDLHLIDAMLDFRKGPGYSFLQTDDFASILYGIKYARTLTLCRWTFERLICPFLSRTGYPFCWNLKLRNLVELWWIDYEEGEKYNSDVLTSFLRRCPFLETLTITIDTKGDNVLSADMRSNEASKATVLDDLGVVKLIGFRNQEDEILLAKQLKEVFSVEPRIVASSDGRRWRSLARESELVEENVTYKFVEERRHINWLCPKHPHMSL